MLIYLIICLRYKIANGLAKKSLECYEKGDLKDINKGMKYLRIAEIITPSSELISTFTKGVTSGKQLRTKVAEKFKKD